MKKGKICTKNKKYAQKSKICTKSPKCPKYAVKIYLQVLAIPTDVNVADSVTKEYGTELEFTLPALALFSTSLHPGLPFSYFCPAAVCTAGHSS